MREKFFGVDVSKDTLDVACDGKVERIENNQRAIRLLVKSLPEGSYVAMEATNTYHLDLADLCFAAGMRVYVVNPRVTRHYREATSLRGHNDRMDALTVASYLEHHHEGLRSYIPKSADDRRLQTLIRRRSKLVTVRSQLKQSLAQIKEIKSEVKALVERIDKLVSKLELLISQVIGDNPDRKRIDGIVGVGEVVSSALFCDLRSGEFRRADSFVAFEGLDLLANDSGRSKGKRRLSKQGNRITRTLLYNAAMSAIRSDVWKPIYEQYLARGLSKIQAIICIARKIARAAWSIYTHKTTFDPARICAAG